MADDTSSEPPQAGFTTRIRRSASGLLGSGRGAQLRERWRSSKWLRRGGYALVVALVIYAVAWVAILRGLPSTDMLLTYQPPLPTMVRGIDGEIVSSYARDRRVQLRYVDIPQPVIHAYLAAEDKNFFSHSGVDYGGLAQAVADYVLKFGSGRRARGGSTITQQVAKNILIGNEYSVGRKFKEMILARRIEGVLTKEQILELYLNQIALGRRSFGIQAASRAYFAKDVGELSLDQAAFLAILPKAPETYSRARFESQAIERRNWVLDQMVRNGWASRADADAAKARPLGLVNMAAEADNPDAGYFLEEVRRQLIDQFGESSEDGNHSVYAGGLWVRTSLDTKLQTEAQNALRAELIRYSGGRGWHGPIAHFDISSGNWQTQLVTANLGIHYLDWRVGIVIEKNGTSGRIGFVDGSSGALISVSDQARPGDVIAVAPAGAGSFAMRLIPEVSGGMVVEDPQNGRVEAMQGGFDARLGAFNRATQAMRQPGSTIKPFVYATALDYGMTPSSMVEDGTFCVYQGAALGQKCFKNFGNEGGSGQHTMRWGLEQSRNLMTVRKRYRDGARRPHHQEGGDRRLFALSVDGAGRRGHHRQQDGECLFGHRQPGAPARADAGRLRRGSRRQGDLALRRTPMRRLQDGRMGRQADAARARSRANRDGPTHRVPGRAHARRRGHARHRGHPERHKPAAVRQDRDHLGPDQRVVRRGYAATDRGRLHRFRPAAQPGRLCARRSDRRAGVQAIPAGDARSLERRAGARPQGRAHGQGRSRVGPSGVCGHARQPRGKGVDHLGSVQARSRTRKAFIGERV
jgi:hypothetical protein